MTNMLLDAAKVGHVAAANALLNTKKNIWAMQIRKQLLSLARGQGRVDVVQILVNAGVDKEWNAPEGFTALHIACHCGHYDVAKILLAAGADKEKVVLGDAHHTPLCIACQNGRVDVVQLLIDAGVDMVKKSSDGFCPLRVAQFGKFARIVEMRNMDDSNLRKT